MESPTHIRLKQYLEKGLREDGFEVKLEKYFKDGPTNGRMDIYAVNEENGSEMEVEVWKTNMPNRFVIRVKSGKVIGIDYQLEQNELETKKKIWQQLSEEEKPKPIYREREQYEICQQFLNLITSGKIQLESNRILDALNEIFSFMRRRRSS